MTEISVVEVQAPGPITAIEVGGPDSGVDVVHIPVAPEVAVVEVEIPGLLGGSAGALIIAPIAPPVEASAGIVTFDLVTANTFQATLTGQISGIAFLNPPPAGRSERVTLYLAQDDVGGRTVAGWTGVRWSGGPPVLSVTPHAIDCLVFDIFDGGQTVFGNLVGLDYR